MRMQKVGSRIRRQNRLFSLVAEDVGVNSLLKRSYLEIANDSTTISLEEMVKCQEAWDKLLNHILAFGTQRLPIIWAIGRTKHLPGDDRSYLLGEVKAYGVCVTEWEKIGHIY